MGVRNESLMGEHLMRFGVVTRISDLARGARVGGELTLEVRMHGYRILL